MFSWLLPLSLKTIGIKILSNKCIVGVTSWLGIQNFWVEGEGVPDVTKKSVTPNPKQEVFFTKTVCQGMELITQYFEHLANIFFYKSCGRDLIHNFYAKNHFNNYLKRGLHI